MKDHGCLEHHHNCYFTRILFHFANSLRIILDFLEDHCDVGLQLILTWLVLLYYERIPKKQDGSCLIGRTPSFCGEYSQLFIHQVCAFLGYSNYKQFFLFKAFCFRNFSPTLEKSWLHPWHSPLKIVQATIILLPQKISAGCGPVPSEGPKIPASKLRHRKISPGRIMTLTTCHKTDLSICNIFIYNHVRLQRSQPLVRFRPQCQFRGWVLVVEL